MCSCPSATVLQQGLPADVYKQMAQEFDTIYPPAVRCKPGSTGCWQDQGRPDRLYAFSADSIWHNSDASRAVTALDFSDPVWLRLGFINELNYNWFSAAPDAHRADRDRRFWMGFKRWHLAMPWFEMVSLPAALCRRAIVLARRDHVGRRRGAFHRLARRWLPHDRSHPMRGAASSVLRLRPPPWRWT